MIVQTSVTKQLFAELRKLIPGIPEKTCELSLTLQLDRMPVIVCKSRIAENGEEVEKEKIFHVTEVTNEKG